LSKAQDGERDDFVVTLDRSDPREPRRHAAPANTRCWLALGRTQDAERAAACADTTGRLSDLTGDGAGTAQVSETRVRYEAQQRDL
jgi:hypothetical protein